MVSPQSTSTPVVSPIPGEVATPFLAHVASTYADRDYQIHRYLPSGLGVTVPFPTHDELNAIYASNYDYGAHTLIEGEKRWRARKLIELALGNAGTAIRSALDVGCMYGYLLEELRQSGVSRVAGIELSAEPASVARGKGFDVHQGTIEAFAASHREPFDAIFAQHVIEHVSDPPAFLKCAFDLLTPGGMLVLAVPHFGCKTQKVCGPAWGWYQVPVHLFHFSRNSLEILCKKAGFSEVREEVRGGDSLFMLMTAHHLVKGVSCAEGSERVRLSPLRKTVIRAASRMLRPYLYVGDEELVIVATKPR
jgi:SAM-dependent methyltransferase